MFAALRGDAYSHQSGKLLSTPATPQAATRGSCDVHIANLLLLRNHRSCRDLLAARQSGLHSDTPNLLQLLLQLHKTH